MLRILCLMILMSGCQTYNLSGVIFPKDQIKSEFEDGTKVSKIYTSIDNDVSYLYREGKTRNGDCRISRTPLVEMVDVDKVSYSFMRLMGSTETCSGKNCSHCAFKKGGGCECKNSTNICEHTITRNRDILRLF